MRPSRPSVRRGTFVYVSGLSRNRATAGYTRTGIHYGAGVLAGKGRGYTSRQSMPSLSPMTRDVPTAVIACARRWTGMTGRQPYGDA